MADEITLTTTITLSNGGLQDRYAISSRQVDQTNQAIFKNVINIGTSEEVISTGDLAAADYGLCVIENLDDTNYVDFGPESGGSMVQAGRAYPNSDLPCILTLYPGLTLRAQANTAACDVLVTIYGR